MKKKFIMLLASIGMCLGLTACDVQIFVTEDPDYAVAVSDSEMETDIYYVKNGTKFTQVYMPEGNVAGKSTKVSRSRILYFEDDEDMIPVHYKGEIIAYSSAETSFDSMTLERFYDIGYSFGFWGGSIEDDGYYHIDTSQANTRPGSLADQVFNALPSNEVRIISVNDTPISEMVDDGSGLILGLEEGKDYIVELYAGTYYKKYYMTADTHMLRSYEVYNYSSEYISDTTHGYMSFSTPETLKSGWYLVNGQGLMKYYDMERGEVTTEDIDLNEPYYMTAEEALAAYSRAYNVNIPTQTKDLEIRIEYEDDASVDEDLISASVVSPDGTVYEMTVDEDRDIITLSMAKAMAGDWKVYIYPVELTINNVDYYSSAVNEETTIMTRTFTVEEAREYMMFYAEITGDSDNVYGAVIDENGVTYRMDIGSTTVDRTKITYLYYKCPYLNAGNYTMKIYYYKSMTTVDEPIITPYETEEEQTVVID